MGKNLFPSNSEIYCFENIINNKRYVGQAINLNVRIRNHKGELKKNKSDCKVLQNAYNKYGLDNFRIWIVEECEVWELDNREIFWIKELNSHKTEHGYNISWGGSAPMRGLKHSQESRNKISKYGRLYHHVSEEGRHNISIANTGYIPSEETREKMAESAKHRPPRSKESLKLSSLIISGENNPNYGKLRSKEVRYKISESHKGMKYSEETKRKQSEKRKFSKHKDASSKYIGVFFIKKSNNWESKIQYNKKTIYIGRFVIEEDAALAYNKKAIDLYGDEAKLNIIENKGDL